MAFMAALHPCLLAALILGAQAAAGESGPPSPPAGIGQLLIQDAQSNSTVRLNVARYHVHAVLKPPVALVQIDQSFYNPFSQQQGGEFVFNLPLGASVSRFAMYVSREHLIEGELVERKRASDIYETIVSRRRDPAILEQLGDNLFKMRVFPIPAFDEKRILLDFTLPLERLAGQYQFRLPLLSDQNRIWDFRISGVIGDQTDQGSVACASHKDLKFQSQPNGSVAFELMQQDYRPASDLVITFAERVDRKASLRTYVADPPPSVSNAASAGGENSPADPWARRTATYFLAEVPSAETSKQAAAPADVLVLADTSSSIRDLNAVRRAVQQVFESLRPNDRVRIVCADVSVRPLHAGWLSATEAKDAHGIDQEFSLGKSDLDACLRQAVKEFDGTAGGRRRLLIYVGDGADDSIPIAKPAANQAACPWFEACGASLVVIETEDTNLKTDYLRSLVAASSGLWFDLARDLRATRSLSGWLKGGLVSPQRVLSAAVDGASEDDLFFSRGWVPGEPLYIYGRAPETRELKLHLKLQVGDRTSTRDWTFPVTRRDDDVFVGRLWAQQRLDRLRRADQQQEAVRTASIALSQEWSLLSPHTAFLVLESEEQYKQWGLARSYRRRYWKPAETRPDSPLPPKWIEQVRPTPTTELSDSRFSDSLRTVKEALSARDFERAQQLLRSLAHSSQAAKSGDFQALRRETIEGVKSRIADEQRERRRGFLDPTSPLASADLQASVASLLGSAFLADPEFSRRHPHAEQLLREIEFSRLAQGKTLDGFARQLSELIGTDVQLDRKALADMGIEETQRYENGEWKSPRYPEPFGGKDKEKPVPVRHSSGRISLKSGVRQILRQLGLVLIDEKDRILITTPEVAESRLITDVYPVADLIFTDRVTPLWMLMNPILDRQERLQREWKSRLKQPLSLEVHETPLEKVVEQLATSLHAAVLLDHKSLADLGIAAKTPLTASIHDVPAGKALEWILSDLGLTYLTDDDALVVTTPEMSESLLEIRLYSGRGLLLEYPADRLWDTPIQGWGMGGMMGGAGGAAMGGGLGGMPGVGGMGGSGFGLGGGFFGGTRRSSGSEASRAAAGMWSGDDVAQPPDGVSDQAATADSTIVASDTNRILAEERYVADADSIIEIVSSTVAPDSWDAVGGRGSIEYFPYSLDFVFAQTREVHEQVEELFVRLRKVPPAISKKSGARPATVAAATVEDTSPADLDTIIWLITAAIESDSWDGVGGPGSIEGEMSRAALVVSQTQNVHEEVEKLLTMLRRHRFEALYGNRPWDASQSAGLRPAAALMRGDEAGEPARLSDYPAAQPSELALLRVRREAGSGTCVWNRSVPARTSEQITLARDGNLLQCEIPAYTLRTDGDSSAIAWRGLRLVELGVYPEVLRRVVDTRLPWLPHRSNEELARLFEVSAAKPTDAKLAGDDIATNAVWLRLVPAGLARDGDTYLHAAYSREHGRIVAWESYVGGKLSARIRFSGPSDTGTPDEWEIAEQQDAGGRQLARWELITTSAQLPAIPPVAEGWKGYVHLDRRADHPAVDAPFAESLKAMRDFDWARAAEQLGRLTDDRARHPLVRLLLAWCLENNPALGTHDRLVAHLLDAAQSDAPDLLTFVSDGHFTSLTSDERFAVLSAQPDATRTAEDCDRLADAAIAAGKQPDALRYVEDAIARGCEDGRLPERQRRCVELLLRLERTQDALAKANEWSTGDRTPHDLVSMAELLSQYAQSQLAESLFGRALDAKNLPAEDRYRLLCRWAGARQGVSRCEKLLEAAKLKASGSRERFECVGLVRQVLSTAAQAETAGQLAAKIDDAELSGELLLLQSELTHDSSLAAELVWQLHETGRLNVARLAWACQVWNRVHQSQRVIAACEKALRSGLILPAEATTELAAAYREEGRDLDAKRASAQDVLSKVEGQVETGPGRFGGSGMF
jgi:hypothetical protein